MHPRWPRARQIVRRLPFTLISLAVLGLVAVLTNSRVGDLPRQWFNRLAFARLPNPWRWAGGGLVLAGLETVFLVALFMGQDTVVVSFDLAHLLAFPLGWLSSVLGRRSAAPGRGSAKPGAGGAIEQKKGASQ